MAGSGNQGFFVAMIAILAMLVVAYFILNKGGGGGDSSGSNKIQDGNTLTFSCRGSVVPEITEATYEAVKTGSSCQSVDVKAFMQAWVKANPGKQFVVTPGAFPGVSIPPCSETRQLAISYNCVADDSSMLYFTASPGGRREGLMPRRVDTCTTAQDVLPAAMADPDPFLHAWSGQDNKNFTAAVTPWDPDSRQQLETAALTAGARQMHRPVNPLTRIGVTDRVLNWDNPYAGDDISSSPCSSAVSVYEVQPFQPGFLIPKENDSTDGTMAQQRTYYQPAYWSRASGPYGGPYQPVASCPEDLGIDSDFAVNGAYETAVVGGEMESMKTHPGSDEFWWQTSGGRQQPWVDDRNERNLAELVGVGAGTFSSTASPARRGQASFVRPKETLRSRDNYRQAAYDDQCQSGIGCGLGSTWIDPRFEPGPQEMYPGGDAAYAHGGHAGGPTFGAFIPAVFQTSGTWDRYVHGFGDGNYVAPTAPRGFVMRA
jgi:hypothetical protein